MTSETVVLSIPFESLVESVSQLSIKDKRRLWDMLDEQIGQMEEETWDQDPTIRSQIHEARSAYQKGDYVTIDDYVAKRREKV